MIRTTGAEWKRFYADPDYWAPGAYHDDEVITVDRKTVDLVEYDMTTVPDTAVITVEGGDVLTADGDSVDSLEGHFKKWRKSQTTVLILAEVPVGLERKIKDAIQDFGGKIL